MGTEFEAVRVEAEVKEVSLEGLISRGLELRERKDNISWELGDLAEMVTDEFGAKYLNEFSKGIGIEVSTIRRYRDVSKIYEPEDREEYRILSWTHFRQVAAFPNRLELLKRAADEGWSVEKLGVMAKGDKSGIVDDGQPVPPKPEMMFDPVCRRWGFTHKEDAKNICPNDGSCEFLNK